MKTFLRVCFAFGFSLWVGIAQAQSLDKKIGQMLMVSFSGTSSSDKAVSDALELANNGLISGVIFYAGNVKNPVQVKELTNAFNSTKGVLPLFVAIDQEGGKVQRLRTKNGHKSYPSARSFGLKGSLEKAYESYFEMACMLNFAGFNLNFGPVADLHSNKSAIIGKLDRAYSSDPSQVIAFASSFVQAHRDCGIITSLKHFPGHGNALKDSHKGFVDVTADWTTEELLVFEALIASDYADMMMIAHVFHRGLDPDHPASLSNKIVDGLLRKRNNYDGVAVTDDLGMGAIKDHYSFKEKILKAIEAGNDLLLIGASQKEKGSVAANAMKVIHEAIAEGRITERRIDQSFQRIKRLKDQFLTPIIPRVKPTQL